MAIKVIKEPAPKAGNLGKPELYALAIGQVIGAGVITLIVPAIKMTGYSAWLAYFCAILMGFVMILPHVFLSSTVRLGGGAYSMLCDLAGPRVSGVFAIMFLGQSIGLSLFGVSAAAYMGDIIPAMGSHTARIIVGVSLITFFYIINMMGIDMMAKAQKAMTWLLIAALVLFAIMGTLEIKLPIFDFADPNFMPNGAGITFTNGQISGGFTGAILLFVYSCSGYYMTTSYGRAAKDAKRDIPWVLIMAVPTLMILYVGVAIAATGSVTLEEYGDSTTLVFAAQRIFPPWLFYFFIIGGPIMALLSTLNSTFAFSAINIGQSCDDGWLPKKFGETNAKGSRKYILTVMWIVGIIPILLNFSITVLTNMIQLMTSVFAVLNFIAFVNLPRKYPEAWKNSRFHVPTWLYYTFCVISLCMYVVVFWKSTLSMSPILAGINIGLVILATIIGLWRGNKGNIEIHTSVWAD